MSFLDPIAPMPALTRRQALLGGLAAAVATRPVHAAGPDLPALMRQGGAVAVFRHALAPGTFDPPGFQLGQCATQRNLSDAGRAQARALGEWFTRQGLRPARVRSSPWCRCMDTATLAFGVAQAWPALGSPTGLQIDARAQQLRELQAALVQAAARTGSFEVWVTHMFVIADLTGANADSGDGVLIAPGREGLPARVLATLDLT